jgi:hypothetical protein
VSYLSLLFSLLKTAERKTAIPAVRLILFPGGVVFGPSGFLSVCVSGGGEKAWWLSWEASV